MTEEMARSELPKWAKNAVRIVDEDDDPIMNRRWKHENPTPHRRIDWERLVKRYGIVVASAALFTLYTIVLSWCVHAGAVKQVRNDLEAEYDAKLAEYKEEQARAVQADYWMSGEASLENQINTEADMLSRVDIWATDDAYLTFVCNVLVRVMRGDYPGSVAEVLKQVKQYDFYDETKPIDKHRREITIPLLRELHRGVFPANLTTDYAWLEMQKDGAICVLHSKDEYYTNGDTTWRYQG